MGPRDDGYARRPKGPMPWRRRQRRLLLFLLAVVAAGLVLFALYRFHRANRAVNEPARIFEAGSPTTVETSDAGPLPQRPDDSAGEVSGEALKAHAAAALDVPLTFGSIEEPHSEEEKFWSRGAAALRGSTAPPPGAWKLPRIVSRKPYFTLLTLGDEERLMLFDQRVAGGPLLRRMYFDANGNGDLTDDPVSEGAATDWNPNEVRFRAVEVIVTAGGASYRYCLAPELKYYKATLARRFRSFFGGDDPKAPYIRLRGACWYTGVFEFKGRGYRLWLDDRNCNGRFDEMLSVEEHRAGNYFLKNGDRLCLAALPRKRPTPEGLHLCDRLFLDGTLFTVVIDMREMRVRLTPIEEGLARVTWRTPLECLTLQTGHGRHAVFLFQPGAAAALPPGRYRLIDYTAHREDGEGDLWELEARGTPDTALLTVAEGEKTRLALGEPYSPAIEVARRRIDWPSFLAGASTASIDFLLKGDAGEQVERVACVAGEKSIFRVASDGNKTALSADRRYPRNPSYTIVLENGEVVNRGSFQCYAGYCYQWATCRGVREGVAYRVLFDYQAGPFETECRPFPVTF